MTAINVSTAQKTVPQTAGATRTEVTKPVGDGPNYLAIYVSSILGISMVFLLGVAVPAAMVYGNATGWGLGAFCAFWGGPGFGVMVGSARVSMWHEKHEAHD